MVKTIQWRTIVRLHLRVGHSKAWLHSHPPLTSFLEIDRETVGRQASSWAPPFSCGPHFSCKQKKPGGAPSWPDPTSLFIIQPNQPMLVTDLHMVVFRWAHWRHASSGVPRGRPSKRAWWASASPLLYLLPVHAYLSRPSYTSCLCLPTCQLV